MEATAVSGEEAAVILDNAFLSVTGIDQIGLDLSMADAYAVQAAAVQRRLERGERLIGLKMGMTSKAKMEQVNLKEVLYGRLTDAMRIENGGVLKHARFIQPRVEPEIAFRLKAPLSGVVSAAEALAAIDGVAPAMEILDSRFKNFKFNVADAIADNCSSAAIVIGEWQQPEGDFSNLGMVMEIDGEPVGIGSSAAILGDPILTLVEAARLIALYGGSLRAGDVFMSGASTAAVPFKAGSKITLRVHTLGRCEFSVV